MFQVTDPDGDSLEVSVEKWAPHAVMLDIVKGGTLGAAVLLTKDQALQVAAEIQRLAARL